MAVFIIVMGSVFALIALLMLIVAHTGARNRRAWVAALARELGAGPVEPATALGYRRPVPAFETERKGRRLRIFARAGGRYPSVGIEWRTAPLPLVLFRKENWRDRLGRRVFLNREVQTGDTAFDRAVYVESDEPASAVAELLASDAVRAAIVDALRRGYNVTTSREGIGTQIIVRRGAIRAGALEPALDALRPVADAVSPASEGAGVRRRARGDLLAIAMPVALGLGYLLMNVALAAKPDGWEPYLTKQAQVMSDAAAAAAVLLIPIAFLWIRGHSRSLRNFVVVVGFGVVAIPMLVPTTAWWLNSALDTSASVAYDSQVTGKRERHGRSFNYHSVQFRALFSSTASASLGIDYDLWRTLGPGDGIRIHLRDGRFGWKWVSGVERIEPNH